MLILDQFAGELHPLGLAAGERGRRLAELHVVEPHVVQRLELVVDGRDVLEVLQRLLNVHLQHLGDRLALVADLQRLAVEAVPLAHRAGDPNVGQKVHFQLVRAVALAGLAAAAADVEAEPPRLVAAGLRLGQLRVEVANLVEHLDVRGRVRPRRAADRRLVDGDHLVEMFEAVDPLVRAGIAEAAVQIAPQGLDQNVVDQRALARAGNAGDADEHAQRNLDVDALEVVVRGAADDELGVADGPALGGNFDPPLAGKILAR